MPSRVLSAGCAVLLWLSLSGSAYAQFSFDSFLTVSGTPEAINNANEVVGWVGTNAFYRNRTGTVLQFSYPNAVSTQAYGINNAGVIVGGYTDGEYLVHGFIRSASGTFTSVDIPNSYRHAFYGINDAGVTVGQSQAGGFVRAAAGTIQVLQAGTAVTDAAYAVNNAGQIVTTFGTQIIVFNSAGQVTGASAAPCAISPSDFVLFPKAITSAGRMAGTCAGRLGLLFGSTMGFIKEATGAVTSIHVPPPSSDWPQYPVTGLNDNGVFTGSIPSSDGQPLGYISIPCSVTLGTANRAHGALSESGSISVSAASDCGYLVRNSAPDWIQVSQLAFTGARTISYTVSANYTRSARTATLTVGGQAFTITQSAGSVSGCTTAFLVGGTPASSVNLNSSGVVPNEVSIGIAPGCNWTASSDAPWLQINGAPTRTGAGALQIAVARNPAAVARTGHIIAGSASLIVFESAGNGACTYGGDKSVTMSWQGGTGAWQPQTVNCSGFFVSSDAAWAVPTSPAGDGSFSYSVSPNFTGATRYASITLNAGGAPIAALRIRQPGQAQQSGLRFKALRPCRIADTRNPAGLFGGPSMAGGATRDFQVLQSGCGVPANAQAYSLNVTVVPQGPLGYLTIWPAGQGRPLVSTLNSPDGSVVANSAIVPAGSQGSLSVYVSNTTHVILDINGYFVPATDTDALAYYPITPCRAVDTRGYGATGAFGTPSMPTGGSSRAFPLRSTCGVPSSASVFVLNFTVVPGGDLAYLTAWPSDQAQPLVSTLNAKAGRIVANQAIVPASSNGSVSVFTSFPGSAGGDVIIDIIGYFAAATASDPLSFYPVAPFRALDTRNNAVPPPAGNTETTVALKPQYPAYSAVVANITAVPSGPLSYLQAYAANIPQPNVSTLNATDGRIVSNAVIVPLSGMAFKVFTSTAAGAPANFIVDVNGYFAP